MLDWLFTRRRGASRSAGPAGDDDLFDEEFQRRLEYLAIVARRTCTLKIRPRISVAFRNSPSACAASGKRTICGSEPSGRSYTAMPQPES